MASEIVVALLTIVAGGVGFAVRHYVFDPQKAARARRETDYFKTKEAISEYVAASDHFADQVKFKDPVTRPASPAFESWQRAQASLLVQVNDLRFGEICNQHFDAVQALADFQSDVPGRTYDELWQRYSNLSTNLWLPAARTYLRQIEERIDG